METELHRKLREVTNTIKTKSQFIGCHQLRCLRKQKATLTKKVKAWDQKFKDQHQRTHQLTIKI